MEATEMQEKAEAIAEQLSLLPGNYREAQKIGPRLQWLVEPSRDDEPASATWRKLTRSDGFAVAMHLQMWPAPASWSFFPRWPNEWLQELGNATKAGPKTRANLERPPAAVARQILAKVVMPGIAQWLELRKQWDEHQDAKRRAETHSMQLVGIGGFGWSEIQAREAMKGEERFLTYHSQVSPLWAEVRVGGWKEDGSCELNLRRATFKLTTEIVALIRAHEEAAEKAERGSNGKA
jgi:hypothetical protein